jgi:RimJ/RimL family protein N-acetyltransferase
MTHRTEDSATELRPSYPITTARLLLRPIVAADADALHAYRAHPEVCRYVPFAPQSLERVRELIATTFATTALTDEGQALTLAVVERSRGTLLGDVVLFWRSREHRGGEIGYVFDPAHGGHGYATEAADELLRLAFDGLGLHRVIARVDARNDASVRVLERLRLRREAHLVENEWFKGAWSDELDYAILDREWRDARGDVSSAERRGQIGDQVVRVLDADRQPDEVTRHLEG